MLIDEKRPEGVSLAGDIKAPLKHNTDMSPTAALEGGSQEPGVTMQQTYGELIYLYIHVSCRGFFTNRWCGELDGGIFSKGRDTTSCNWDRGSWLALVDVVCGRSFFMFSLSPSSIEGILQRALQSFRDTLTDPAYVARHSLLQKLIGNILAGSTHIDDLFPYFMNHTREKYPAVMVVPQLQKISDLTKPHLWSAQWINL